MKESTRISMAVYELFQNLRRNIYIILMLTACLVLIMYSIIIYYGSDYNYMTTNEILKNTTGRTGLFTIYEFNQHSEYEKAFYKMAAEAGCIKAHSGFKKEREKKSELFAEYPESKLVSAEREKGYTMCLRATPHADEIINIDLLEGIPLSELEFDEKVYITYYYLGYDYREIPLGTVSEKVLSDGTKQIDVVAGVLQKGQRWITTYPFIEMSSSSLSSYISTDDALLIINEDAGGPEFFTFDSDHTFEQVRRKCNEISKELGCEVDISLLEDSFNLVRYEKGMIYDMIAECIFILIISALCVLMCTIYIEFMQGKRRYGLFYAIGMSRRDVERILAWKRIIEISVAALLSYFVIDFSIKHLFWVEGDVGFIISDVMARYCLWRMGLIIAALAAIYIGASIFMLRRCSPTELLKRKE